MTIWLGVSAQELRQTNPDAVEEGAGGFLTVAPEWTPITFDETGRMMCGGAFAGPDGELREIASYEIPKGHWTEKLNDEGRASLRQSFIQRMN